jgi:CitMHS family citrate-Mg2+:H+ or citrate-Ca2+:H+ symporter
MSTQRLRHRICSSERTITNPEHSDNNVSIYRTTTRAENESRVLALLGLVTVLLVLVLVVCRLTTPVVALIVVPVVTATVGGFAGGLGGFVVAGVQQTAPVAAMFVFAILYFGVITDAGVLDPFVSGILRAVGNRPTRIAVGTALLALIVHLDGSGAVTFLVTIPAMLPLYDRLGMDRRVLACTASLAAGVNFLPWTGPVLRASAALHISTADLFRPLLAVQAVGLVWVFTIAFLLGRREERRLGLGLGLVKKEADAHDASSRTLTDDERGLRRPRFFWINVLLTIAAIAAMVSGVTDPAFVFMIATAIALLLNYPGSDAQRARMDAHAKSALTMAAILLAAGAFTGIMKGSGMLSAMAKAAVDIVPTSAARHIPLALGLLSMPLSLLFDPDSFYLGALPVIAEVAHGLGVPPIQVGQAALLGQMTTGFPVSPLTPATFLVVGLSRIELGEHQRFTAPFLFGASVLMTIACLVSGVFPP